MIQVEWEKTITEYISMGNVECQVNNNVYFLNLLPIVDWIDFPTLYIGRVHSHFQIRSAMRFDLDIPREKWLMAKIFANSGEPDQTPHNAASDLGLHCLPITLLGVSRLQWVRSSVKDTSINLFLRGGCGEGGGGGVVYGGEYRAIWSRNNWYKTAAVHGSILRGLIIIVIWTETSCIQCIYYLFAEKEKCKSSLVRL